MQYKKPPRYEKPSELIEVKHGYGGNGSEYLSLVLLIASANIHLHCYWLGFWLSWKIFSGC